MATPTGNARRAMQCNRAAFEASCTPVDDAPATPPTTFADCSVILIAGYGTVKRRGVGASSAESRNGFACGSFKIAQKVILP